MSFSQFFATLRARWKVALGTLLVIVGVTLAVNLLLPSRYAAVSTVVVDTRPDPVSSMLYGGGPSQQFMATQINVLSSMRVATRVVQTLRLSENPQLRTSWLEETGGTGDITVWIGELLLRSLEVLPAKDSNMLTVTYESPDPGFSATMANAFVQAYVDTFVDMRTDPAKQYTTFFDARAKQARERLEQAQAKLSAFQNEKGLVATDERVDIETARLNELSSQLVALQAVAAETRSRRGQANNSPETAGDVINNPIVAGLRAELLRLETQLQELNTRLGPNNPQVIDLNTRIASVRGKIGSESRRIASSVALTDATSETRVGEVRAALEAQREKLLKLKATRDEASVLQRDVVTAQTAFDTLQNRLTASTIESQAAMTNVYVLSRATAPTRVSSPKTVRNVAIAVSVGLLLALAAAFVRELFDRRVRSVADLVAELNIPVLGTLPRPQTRRLFGPQRLAPIPERVLGQLPRPAQRPT